MIGCKDISRSDATGSIGLVPLVPLVPLVENPYRTSLLRDFTPVIIARARQENRPVR
jgi:hypothetical protein